MDYSIIVNKHYNITNYNIKSLTIGITSIKVRLSAFLTSVRITQLISSCGNKNNIDRGKQEVSLPFRVCTGCIN